jgi:hypothetical protein
MADESERSEGKGFLDRLREATSNVTQMTREGVENLQTRHELSQTYADLGRKTAELVESGAISHPELTEMVQRIGELKASLAAGSGEAGAADAAGDEAAASPEPDEG